MSIAIVVGYDNNRAIGRNGDLPWGRDLPADLQNFKRLTMNGSVIMGRKTFESMGSRPLPDRENIVITSEPTGVKGVLSAIDLLSAIALARYPTFIIGGQRVYTDSLAFADTIYATEVASSFENCDVFFPEIDDQWQEVSRIHHPIDTDNKFPFDFVKYQKTTTT